MIIAILAIAVFNLRPKVTEEDFLHQMAEADDFFPDADLFPEPESVFCKTVKRGGIFPSQHMAVTVKGEQNYKTAMSDIGERFQVLDMPISHDTEHPPLPEEGFMIGSYTFYVVQYFPQKDEHSSYPQLFGTIGISNDEKTVMYLWTDDFDLDYIDDLREYITDSFLLDID